MTATKSVQLTAKSPAEVAPAAAAVSLANPGRYVTVVMWDFGVVRAQVTARLPVFAPTDSWGDHYWLNGKAKPFTSAQRRADSMATPSMS